ncbi:MAG: formate dehydrogenase accessory sulfurtransferase FdhD [Coriobacteriaceae bacterium]|nr:formate dehydrogenase accessory sulfurtransferase FdhD [Coriobacteriaceae bacterium]
MEISNLFTPDDELLKHSVRLCTPAEPDVVAFEEVQVEHSMEVFVNEIPTFTIVCSPDRLPELVLGRLCTQGIVRDAEEVESIYICQHATRARVFLRDRQAQLQRRHVEAVPSCCTGNRTLNSYFEADEPPAKVVPIPWDRRWIFSLARSFALDTPLHRRTMGTHSCYLAIGEQILYCCEDLGRHNAFDKVVGEALLDEVDLSQAIVYTSGRIPVDMVMKAIRARIPILVTKAVPTDATIELAREFDLTLICQARPDSFKVFNDPANPICG